MGAVKVLAKLSGCTVSFEPWLLLDAISTKFLCAGLNIFLTHPNPSVHHALTHCILMDFPIHINTISMGLHILRFKGSQVADSKSSCISVPEGFNFSKQCRP